VILGVGVAVCLLLSTHRAVIFAIAQLSCKASYNITHSEGDVRIIKCELHRCKKCDSSASHRHLSYCSLSMPAFPSAFNLLKSTFCV